MLGRQENGRQKWLVIFGFVVNRPRRSPSTHSNSVGVNTTRKRTHGMGCRETVKSPNRTQTRSAVFFRKRFPTSCSRARTPRDARGAACPSGADSITTLECVRCTGGCPGQMAATDFCTRCKQCPLNSQHHWIYG